MADDAIDTGLPTPPSGEAFYRQAAGDFAVHEAERAAGPDVAPGPPATGPAPDADVYAPYRKPGVAFDLYKPGEQAATYRASLDDLLAQRDDLKDFHVSVTDPDGTRRGVRVGDLEQALGQGFKAETAQEGVTRRFLEDNKGLSGDAKAAIIAYSDELFLGVPGAYFDRTLDPYQRANIEALRREHGFANALGTAAGFGGSLLTAAPLFKGAAAAGRVAGGAVEKAAARALAGRLTEAGVTEGAPSLARALLAEAAGSAAKLGTEAGVIAAPKAITEEALGDHEAAAETLLYAIGGGAALGGLATGAKELFSRVRKGAETAVGSAGEAAAGASTALDKVAGAYASVRGKGEEVKGALERAYAQDAGRLARQDEILDRAVKAITEAGNPVLRAEDAITEAAIQQKPEQMWRLVDPSKRLEQRAASLEIWDDVRKELEFWKGTHAKGGLEGGVAKLDRWFKDFSATIGDALDKNVAIAHPEKAYILLDNLKRQVGKQAQFGKSMLAVPEAARSFDELYHSIRDQLERVDVWGPAATAQRNVNRAYEAALSTRQKFEQHFVTQYGAVLGRPTDVFDPEKVHAFLSNVGTERNGLREQALADYARGMIQRMDAVEAHYTVSREQKRAFDEGRKALEHLGATVDAARKEAMEVAQIRRMKAEEGAQGVGGFLGLATDAFTRPVATAERLGALQKTVGDVKQWGVLVAEQAMRRAGQELDRIPAVLERLGASKPAVATLPAHVMARFLGGKSEGSRQEQFKALSDKLTAVTANPTAAAARMGALDFHAGGAPNIGEAYGRKQIEAYRYLLETMPRSPKAPEPFAKDAWTPSNAELMAWERRLEVVEDPFAVFRHLETGTLAREHVETLQRVYPRLYEAVRDRVMKAATAPNAPTLPGRARQRLAALLGAPGPAGGKDALGARLQASFAPPPPAGAPPGPPGGGGPGMTPPALGTDVQRISGG